MTSFAKIHSSLAPELARLNAGIRQNLRTDNALMNDVIERYLSTTGKQIRPMIVILTAKMLGDVNDNVISTAAAVELLHNASLIHDDVVDNSAMRRNAPTINAIWDNHIAVLVGDFFVSTSIKLAIDTRDMRVIDSLCHLGRQLSLGELDQIYNARFHKQTEEKYFSTISRKTASLFVACSNMGCYAVGADRNIVDAMAEFTELLGRCFQIRDDIFDYFDSEKVGKPTGNDLKEGKMTLPLLHVLLDESLPMHHDMLALSQKEELSDSEIAELIKYAVDNGGIDYAYSVMHELRDKAASILAPMPESQAKRDMLALFDEIIARDY